MDKRRPVMPSGQNNQSSSCEQCLRPSPRPHLHAPVLYNDGGGSRRVLRIPSNDSDSDQPIRRTQPQTMTPLLGHPDPLELSLAYLPPPDRSLPPPDRSLPPGPVNVEVLAEDDDLIIISPTSFQQAMSSRRTRRTSITDVASARNLRRRLDSQPSHVNSKGSSSSMLQVEPVAPPPLPPPPPPVPTFSCPICLDPMAEESISTECGHLFCNRCIRIAISKNSKCPLCRRRITQRGLQRIYFPSPV